MFFLSILITTFSQHNIIIFLKEHFVDNIIIYKILFVPVIDSKGSRPGRTQTFHFEFASSARNGNNGERDCH